MVLSVPNPFVSQRERVENTSRPGETQVMIQNLMPETVYVFRVMAQNRHGPGESSALLKVATQPEGEPAYSWSFHHFGIHTDFIFVFSLFTTFPRI